MLCSRITLLKRKIAIKSVEKHKKQSALVGMDVDCVDVFSISALLCVFGGILIVFLGVVRGNDTVST